MNNLQKIQKLAVSVRDNLAALKPSSSMDDIDAIAQQRAVLREKLELLTDAEDQEHEKLKAEAAERKAKQRRELLLEVAKKSDNTAKAYDSLTIEVASLVDKLVQTLIEREQVFCREAVGLSTTEFYELLSSAEQRDLIDKLDRSTGDVYEGNFGNNWRKAVNHQCGNNDKLHRRLIGLINLPSSIQKSLLTGARPMLADTARVLADSVSVEATRPQLTNVSPEQPEGKRYEVDLREPNAPAAELISL